MTARRKFLAYTAALAFSAAAASSALAQSVTLRSADIHPTDYPTVEAVSYLGKLVEERTQGRIKINVFHSGQLGQEKDTIEQTRFGVIDINRVNIAPFNNLVPATIVLGLPFLFRSVDHMQKAMDGPIGDNLLKEFETHDLIGLALYDSGSRSFYNSKRPIKSPADMKGMKIRVQQSDMWVALISALGANATPMPFGEVYSALQTGVVDGAENNWPSYYIDPPFRGREVLHRDRAHPLAGSLVMSKRSYDKLSKRPTRRSSGSRRRKRAADARALGGEGEGVARPR